MRISSDWLAEFVTVPEPVRLEQELLMAGLGIEERRDNLFELEVTSNRGDWLSAIGLAREVGAMTEARFRLPAPDVDEDGPTIDGRVHIDIENSADCARYVARVIEGVQVGPSPDWMQERLVQCGMRPINNVVDVSNYVMLEWGQPLHCFDLDKLSGTNVRVRRAVAGEKLETLDGTERELTPDVLVIADSQAPIAIAGVMGGKATEVTESTTRILLESAHFTPNVVRRSAHRSGLGTEASKRFERWVDPNSARRAADRAAQLIAQTGGGQVAYGAIDRYLAPVYDAVVSLRTARCNAVLGLKLSPETVRNCLERLGFKVVPVEDGFRVNVPTWRRDISLEIDLIEEVARIHGYGRIPTTLHAGTNTAAGRPLAGRLEDRARSAMLRCGLTEVTSYSLSNEAAHTRAGLTADEAVRLRNPLSEDHTLLRTSLLPSLLDVLRRNTGRRVRAFELGKAYLNRPGQQLPYEKRVLGIALSDAPPSPHWQPAAVDKVDFFALKAIVESVLKEFGAPEPVLYTGKNQSFHPGRCAEISVDGQELGILGEVHPDVATNFELTGRNYVALLDFDMLVRHLSLVKQYQTFGRFPSADRDLAFVMPRNLPSSTLVAAARQAGGELLESVRIFDVYAGPNLPPDSRSLAFALRFRAADRTLGEADIEPRMEQIIAAVEATGAKLRA